MACFDDFTDDSATFKLQDLSMRKGGLTAESMAGMREDCIMISQRMRSDQQTRRVCDKVTESST